MMLSAINDPDGAQERKKHKLKRREYHNKVRVIDSTYVCYGQLNQGVNNFVIIFLCTRVLLMQHSVLARVTFIL